MNFEVLDKTIRRQMRKRKTPGLALSIIKDNKVIYSKGFGARNLKQRLPKGSRQARRPLVEGSAQDGLPSEGVDVAPERWRGRRCLECVCALCVCVCVCVLCVCA